MKKKKNQKSVRFLTSGGGRSILVGGLWAAVLSSACPMMAGSPLAGGGKFSGCPDC